MLVETRAFVCSEMASSIENKYMSPPAFLNRKSDPQPKLTSAPKVNRLTDDLIVNAVETITRHRHFELIKTSILDPLVRYMIRSIVPVMLLLILLFSITSLLNIIILIQLIGFKHSLPVVESKS